MASAIGDRDFQALAQAALLPYLKPEQAQEVTAELATHVVDLNPARDQDLLALRIVTLLVTTKYLPADSEVLEQFLSMVRQKIDEDVVRAFALVAIATRFPADRGERLFEEAAKLVRDETSSDAALALPLLATFFPGRQAQSLVDEGMALTDASESTAEARRDRGIIRILSVLARGEPLEAIQAELVAAIQDIIRYPKAEERTMCLVFSVLLCPRLPPETAHTLVSEAFEAVRMSGGQREGMAFLGLLMPYLSTARIGSCLKELLVSGARLPRSGLLAGLALVHGLAHELWINTPLIAGNRIPGSPLARVGGDAAVSETYQAIRDVSKWWK
jgi:hypothetical protein